MGVRVQVLIHPLVLSEDFRKIDPADQKKIIKTIRKKLSTDPHAFGKPLTGSLKGYWRLRIGDFRAIYSIVEERVIVKVIKVGIRRDSEVYEEMMRRVPKILGF